MDASSVLEFALFLLVGFGAQLIDGALGMAYGVSSTTFLISLGVTPAHASASVHFAELFTTAASGVSHWLNGNIDWRLFRRLAPAGIVGGALGTFVLTGIDGQAIRPYVVAYLAIMGLIVLSRAFLPRRQSGDRWRFAAPLGVGGGFADAIGGGGWGPIVTSSLLGAGNSTRFTIGTVNAAEFLVTVTISASFVIAMLSGHWEDADGLTASAMPVAGLIVGGLIAAPMAGRITRRVPHRPMLAAVGMLILTLAGVQIAQIIGG